MEDSDRKEIIDPNTKKTYYWNNENDVTQWVKPIPFIVDEIKKKMENLKKISGAYLNKHNELIEIFVYYRACVEMIKKLENLKEKCETENISKINLLKKELAAYKNNGQDCVDNKIPEIKNKLDELRELFRKKKVNMDPTDLDSVSGIIASKDDEDGLRNPINCTGWYVMMKMLLDRFEMNMNILEEKPKKNDERNCCEELNTLKE